MHKSPLLISGIGRSGTSAVISSMSKHKLVVEPRRVGEAPFFNHFIEFLLQYENHSANKDYHLKNYQLDAKGRDEVFSNMLSQIQYGIDLSTTAAEKKYWIAKVSLNKSCFIKACDMFSHLKVIYIMRNGIEVVNSAQSFDGFKDLSFKQLCQRWVSNLKECHYVHSSDNCAVIKHHELVVDPQGVYGRVYEQLGIEHDDDPAKFIQSTLFNSSFDESAKLKSTANIFSNRLECWESWSNQQKDIFIDICDHYMVEYDFFRPYATNANSDGFIRNNANIKGSKAGSATNGISIDIQKIILPHMSIPHFDYHANPSPEHNYLFMENPKVASTSILTILQNFENTEKSLAMTNSHQRDESPIPKFSMLTDLEQKKYLESEEIYRFAFVRNPYSRLLSAYLSKIDTPLRPKAEILAHIKGVHKSAIDDLSVKIDFSTFVDVVTSQSIDQMNPHWKNQVDQILFEKINYSFIGKFENLQRDVSHVENILFGFESNTLKKSKNLTGADSKLEKFYTPELADKVYSKFYSDFQAFGYSRSLSISCAA